MDLREKLSLVQRVSEYSIRFRLPESLAAVLLCIIALCNIDGVLVSIQPLSAQTEKVLENFVHFNFGILTENIGIIFVALLLFVFRWIFFGFKCSLLLFFFLFFNSILLIVVGECKDIMQILLACIFIIAVTSFIFIQSLFVKAMLPFIFLAYSLSTWLLFLGVSNLGWFGLISIFFADAFHLIFLISYKVHHDSKGKRTLSGTIAHGVRKTIPVSLLTIILLIVSDITFYCMNLPTLASEKLLNSLVIYICYAVWMPFFTGAVFSFCPLESTCEKIKKKSK